MTENLPKKRRRGDIADDALIAYMESRNSMEMSVLCTHIAYEEDLDDLFKKNRSSKRAKRVTRAVVETAISLIFLKIKQLPF